VGYRAIFIEGLALESEQFGRTNFLDQSGFHNNVFMLLDATTVGVEFMY